MRSISGATRVAAYSGSLSLTLAFGGLVYVSGPWALQWVFHWGSADWCM